MDPHKAVEHLSEVEELTLVGARRCESGMPVATRVGSVLSSVEAISGRFLPGYLLWSCKQIRGRLAGPQLAVVLVECATPIAE
jgi:hypothetical protein